MLDQTPFQYEVETRRRFVRKGRRFVHYTSANGAASIIREQEVWLRNSSVMNDYSEVAHGEHCLSAVLTSQRLFSGDSRRSSHFAFYNFCRIQARRAEHAGNSGPVRRGVSARLAASAHSLIQRVPQAQLGPQRHTSRSFARDLHLQVGAQRQGLHLQVSVILTSIYSVGGPTLGELDRRELNAAAVFAT